MSGERAEEGAVLFIGVGAMGEPMAARIAGAGYELLLSDIDIERTAAIAAKLGARSFARGEEAMSISRIRTVILMLPSSSVVDEVLIGEGLLALLEPDSVVIDMSSSTPGRTVQLAALAGERGIGFVDAPVSGGVPKARSGELAIMVGGEPEVIDSRRELLGVLGTVVMHVGAHGAGHAMKALNNLLSAVGIIAAAEVLSVAARFGIDPKVALDVINSSTGRNQSTEVKYERYVLSRAFDSGFAMRLMVKDLRTAIELAHAAEVPVPISATALEEWTAAFGSLGRQADHTEVAAYVERRAGVELAERPKLASETITT